MRLRIWLRYLVGDSGAIAEIAVDLRNLWLGALCVFSAALAREYDGEDLLHEPWHLLLPFLASLAASFILFAVSHKLLEHKARSVGEFFSRYRVFLALFWLTAPLAWLYAVPYERFLSAAEATRFNLLTLAVVSLWRVLLMTRVLMVTMGFGFRQAFSLVMAFADGVAVVVSMFLPVPIIALMGGVRLSESQQVLQSVTGTIACFGMFSFPFWCILALTGKATGWRIVSPTNPGPWHWGGWAAVLVSVVGFGLAMLSTQPEQQLRRRVENEIEAGQYVAALGLLSSHPRGDFPPHWDPPPRTFSPFHFRSPGHVLGMCELFDCTTPAWVHEAYLEKLKMMMQLGGGRTEDERSRLVRLLHRLPEAPELLDALREENSHRYEELVEQLRLTETEQDVSKR